MKESFRAGVMDGTVDYTTDDILMTQCRHSPASAVYGGFLLSFQTDVG